MSAAKGECLKSLVRIKRPDTDAHTGPLFVGLGFRCSTNAGPFLTKYNSTPTRKFNGRPSLLNEHTKKG